MMLTENEARQNTCPLIRYCVNESAVIQDDAAAIYVHADCRGSECRVGWRWAESKRAAQARARTFDDPLADIRLGYCGAFGRPEDV